MKFNLSEYWKSHQTEFITILDKALKSKNRKLNLKGTWSKADENREIFEEFNLWLKKYSEMIDPHDALFKWMNEYIPNDIFFSDGYEPL